MSQGFFVGLYRGVVPNGKRLDIRVMDILGARIPVHAEEGNGETKDAGNDWSLQTVVFWSFPL
jgi:hypothetical protein